MGLGKNNTQGLLFGSAAENPKGLLIFGEVQLKKTFRRKGPTIGPKKGDFWQ